MAKYNLFIIYDSAGYIELGSTESALACKLETGLYWDILGYISVYRTEIGYLKNENK